MESKKINQLATELTPSLSDLTIIGDPSTGISKKITLSQMASLFTGTVEEYASLAAFPLVGVADTIYIALDTNVLYRWDTGLSSYVELSPNIINSLVFNDANGFDGTIALVGSVATLTITTALTLGSVPFIGASGALTQDNAKLFWDNTNKWLGIGTNSPSTPLDVHTTFNVGMSINNTTTNNSLLMFANQNVSKWRLGNVYSSGANYFGIYDITNSLYRFTILNSGEVGIGITNPTTKLHIDGGSSALIANLDADVSIAKSLSFRSDNSNRINLEVSGTESGSNAGANFFLRAYSDAGSLLNTPLTITRATGAATFISSVAANKFNSSLAYTFGTATDGTTGQIATDNTDTFFDYKGSLFFRSALASGIRLTIAESGAATFVNDITITKASTASFIANNTSVSGKSYRLLSGDDGIFKIQNTGVLDLVSITSTGVSTFASSVQATKMSIGIAPQTDKLFVYNASGTNAGLTIQQDGTGDIFKANGNAGANRFVVQQGGNVGINNNSPALALDVNGRIRNTFTSPGTTVLEAYNPSATGYGAYISGGVGANYAFQVADYLNNVRFTIRGDGNVGIGSAGGSSTRLSIQAATSNAAIRIDADSGQSAILIGGNGNINVDYPGVSNGRFQLDGNGNVYNRTGVYGTISSDLRLKENIVEASSKLEDILKLRVVNFNLISDADKIKNIGFIAQEMQQVFPSFVYEKDTREYDEEGNVISGYEDSLGVKVGMEFAILVKAIQELKAEIEILKAK
jgi:hypothetical protein